MKNKMIALTLAILLICSVAIPASAATGSISRIVNGYSMNSNDTCNYYDFSCILTYDNSSVLIRTDVDPYYTSGIGNIPSSRIKGPSSYRIASNRGTVGAKLSWIKCLYYADDVLVTSQALLAGY